VHHRSSDTFDETGAGGVLLAAWMPLHGVHTAVGRRE
jgi:hypothetical protein